MHNFDIYFSGKLLPDSDPAQARQAIGKLFKLQGDPLKRLFCGTPVRIKQDVDVDTANRYRAAFREAGTLIDIVPHGQAPAQAAMQANPAADSKAHSAAKSPPPKAQTEQLAGTGKTHLLAPRTGTLEDCAAEVEAQPIPDIDWMKLDPPGIRLDESKPPAPLDIDISGISMAEANSGSLEDCQPKQQVEPLPDISHLALVGRSSVDSED